MCACLAMPGRCNAAVAVNESRTRSSRGGIWKRVPLRVLFKLAFYAVLFAVPVRRTHARQARLVALFAIRVVSEEVLRKRG